ncbi:MAG: outer membrane lipoprotein carrier protein LolA [Bryobacterales bacterium]
MSIQKAELRAHRRLWRLQPAIWAGSPAREEGVRPGWRVAPRPAAARMRLFQVLALAVLGSTLCLTAQAQTPKPSLDKVVAGIELRYNRLATLKVDFEHTMQYLQRQPLVERGTLFLRRPGKMRWEYSKPAGKLLVGDGDLLYYYNPNSNQVRQLRPSQTGDLRVPLSFLLGRLHFRRQFRDLRIEQMDGRSVLVAEGRSGKEAYARVDFTYDPADFELLHLKVYGRDESVTTFGFSEELVNPLLNEALFAFRAPPGAEIVDQRVEDSN